MAKSSSNMPNFRLTKVKVKVRAVPHVTVGLRSQMEYVLPDSSYGQWLILQNRRPKFIYCAFDQQGNANQIADYVEEKNLDIEPFLLELLSNNGHVGVSIPKTPVFSIRNDDKSTLEEFELLRIEDG